MGPEAKKSVDPTCFHVAKHAAWQVYKKVPYGKECDMWSLGIIMFEVGVEAQAHSISLLPGPDALRRPAVQR